MVSQEPINLRGAETTLRLQHQADRGRRGSLQTIQTVLNHVDGLMGQHIQLEPGLIAQPIRQTEAIHAPVVSGAFGPRSTTLEPINHDTKLLTTIEQPIRPYR